MSRASAAELAAAPVGSMVLVTINGAREILPKVAADRWSIADAYRGSELAALGAELHHVRVSEPLVVRVLPGFKPTTTARWATRQREKQEGRQRAAA